MALVVPNDGEVRLLRYIINALSPTNLVLHLYTNNVNLSSETFTSSSFQKPTSISGYTSRTLEVSKWNVASNSGVTSALYNEGITFSFTAAQDIQGYYVTDVGDNIMWAEEFPGAPFKLPSGGGQVAIRPQIQLN